MKLFYKILPIIIIPIIIFTITYQITFTYVISKTLLDSTIMEAEGIIEIISRELQNPVYFLDIDEISNIIENVEKTGWVNSVIVFDADGMIITDGTNENLNVGKIPEDGFSLDSISSNTIMHTVNEDILLVSAPIIITEKIGSVLLEFSLADYKIVIRESQNIIIIITLVVTLMSAIIVFFFSRNLSYQIQRIKEYAHRIAEGKFESNIIVPDIDEIRELTNDLMVMAEKIESTKQEVIKSERLSSIGELSARLAHDLRNPLSVIKNSVFVLEHYLDENKDAKIKQYMEVLKQEVERINHQINEVLGFVKTRPIQITPVSTADILKEAIPDIIPKNITIKLPENDIIANVDREQILIVIRNLVQNSIQSIREKEGMIEIFLNDDDKSSIIEIRDNGQGIPINIMDRIFEPLYTTKQEGTGLGLVTCKTVIEQHGGTISVSNNPNGGVTFTIKIPKK